MIPITRTREQLRSPEGRPEHQSVPKSRPQRLLTPRASSTCLPRKPPHQLPLFPSGLRGSALFLSSSRRRCWAARASWSSCDHRETGSRSTRMRRAALSFFSAGGVFGLLERAGLLATIARPEAVRRACVGPRSPSSQRAAWLGCSSELVFWRPSRDRKPFDANAWDRAGYGRASPAPHARGLARVTRLALRPLHAGARDRQRTPRLRSGPPRSSRGPPLRRQKEGVGRLGKGVHAPDQKASVEW